ncbi:hypothetical protein F5Y19DRAFT_462486 [Xylariaceae sp. FL1651]|nr:hypothetical protein F5Y19DRAFT_462486 [Xylariaceae sp. FL1651]
MPSNLLKIDTHGLLTFKASGELKRGETIKLQRIRMAKLQRVTIIDHEPEGHLVNTINHIMKPLQIMLGQSFMGMANDNDNRFLFVVTWGPGHKSLRLDYFKVTHKAVQDKDAVALARLLDRGIWQLHIDIKPVVQN